MAKRIMVFILVGLMVTALLPAMVLASSCGGGGGGGGGTPSASKSADAGQASAQAALAQFNQVSPVQLNAPPKEVVTVAKKLGLTVSMDIRGGKDNALMVLCGQWKLNKKLGFMVDDCILGFVKRVTDDGVQVEFMDANKKVIAMDLKFEDLSEKYFQGYILPVKAGGM